MSQAAENFRRGEVAKVPSAVAAAQARGSIFRVGVAKIVTNETDGWYTITEQFWDAAAGTPAYVAATASSGLFERDAREISNNTSGAAGDLVHWWEQRDKAGRLEVCFALYSAMRFGVPTTAYTSGATITLDPCDVAGTDNGEANVTVQAGWTLPANTNIPVTAIIPYQAAADGLNYVIGQPREVMTNFQYDTSSHKLQKKVRYDFGVFATTESSAWVDITTAVDCTA